MQPAQQALIGAAHLEAAVLDAIGDDTLTMAELRPLLFPCEDYSSTVLMYGVLERLTASEQLPVEQAVERKHYRYTRPAA